MDLAERRSNHFQGREKVATDKLETRAKLPGTETASEWLETERPPRWAQVTLGGRVMLAAKGGGQEAQASQERFDPVLCCVEVLTTPLNEDQVEN